MIRAPRSRRRYRGKVDGIAGTSCTNIAATSLSGQFPGVVQEADGTGLRRRYALAAAAICLLILSLAVSAGRSGKRRSEGEMEVGDAASIGMYDIVETATLQDVESSVQIMRHRKSGLEVMTMIPDDKDQDSVFGISFRTIPQNTHGTAHVVENAVLAGSEKYPIKDPWNQLHRGSLQTFFDTWTDKDRTVFAMASRDGRDYANSIDVMLDGVFNPLMVRDEHAWIFRREAWRIEAPQGERWYLSGNTFNEAKAAEMKPHFNMRNHIYKALFKDTSYGLDALGDVGDIVSMTQREMVDFYHHFYKPANAQAFCYGSKADVNKCLDKLDETLKEFKYDKAVRESTKIPWQEFSVIQSPTEEVSYPSFQDVEDYRLATTWMINDQPLDAFTEVIWFLLEELMMGTPDGVMARIISDLDLADDLIGGLETDLQQWTFTIGLSGARNEQKIDLAIDAINDELARIVAKGFSAAHLMAAISRVDFKLRDMTSHGVPRGVKYYQMILNKWNYDLDPKQPLLYVKAFEDLRTEIEEDGGTFNQARLLDVIKRYMIDNSHKTTVRMVPSPTLAIQYSNVSNAARCARRIPVICGANKVVACRRTKNYGSVI